jgi:uncharacterized damage-inducible protein DinB
MAAEIDHFARLLRYDGWANAEIAASLGGTSAPPQAVRWLAHIVGSEFLWLGRLTGQPSALEVWPSLDVAASLHRLGELAQAWPRYLSTLDPEDLTDGVGYRNTKGEFWTSTVADILTHVVVHSGYHRGQISAAVRASGAEPAYTDFIHAMRQGLVE